jgi:hypothetical protein
MPDHLTPATAPFLGAIYNSEGLNCAYLGQATALKLKLINSSSEAYHTPLAAAAEDRAGLSVDFGPAQELAPGALSLPGFRPAAGPGLALHQAQPYWTWYADDALVLDLPAVTLSGAPGLRWVRVSIGPLAGHETIALDVPLLALAPTIAAADPAAGTARFANGNTVATGLHTEHAAELTVELPWPDQRPTANGAFYVMLSDGLAPGLASVAAPAQAGAVEATVAPGTGWQLSREGNGPYPVWRLAAPTTPSAAPVLHLRNLRTSHPAGSTGHVLACSVGLPGLPDRAQVLSVRVLTAAVASVSIVSFTADQPMLYDLNAPATVTLAWNVTNAEYITISGVGMVQAQQSAVQVRVEETTVFVLTAYGPGMAQIAAATCEVTVNPPLIGRVAPIGAIMLWSGSTSDIPTGWALCNGDQGTPNLCDKFVMGAGGSVQPNTSGAADTHTHAVSAQSHSFTSSANGGHSHGMPSGWSATHLSTDNDALGIQTSHDSDSLAGVTTASVPDHQHSVTVSLPAITTAANSQGYRPAWYALCYIMKTGA